MAIEPKRGCGYRKVGGIYLVAAGAGSACCKLPIILSICPTCNQGIKQSRGWQWIDPLPWVGKEKCRTAILACPVAPPHQLGERVGLLWIGTKFYSTAVAFANEAQRLGISRRISRVPRGFKVGETWVFLAHPHLQQATNDATGDLEWQAGVFRVFRPERIEKIITASMAKDPDVMADLADRGITPIIVPDNDRDHQGSVYEDDDMPELVLSKDENLGREFDDGTT